ncbi:unnamed protein product [Rotaria socialis]|uniref:Uncharacterized protein n=1 Tax=Rotaria socialis TaxID=392032 RepID=A0A817Y1M8_9BILA|nr:unnamed protein product [Rotaria socialis]
MLTDTDNEYMCKAEILTGQSFESNPLSYLMPWLIPVLSYIIIGQTMWMQFLHKWKQPAEELPRIYSNITYNCAASDACQRLLRIGPSDLILPGLVVGCLPLDGLRLSTLECFLFHQIVLRLSVAILNTIHNTMDHHLPLILFCQQSHQ